MKCVVSGSFRKFYQGIIQVIEDFERCGIEVLSPKISEVMNPENEFVILKSDPTNDIETLERSHLEKIREADFLYIYNPGGYIGKSVAMELGWALALNKPVYALEEPDDTVLSKFVMVKSPQEICQR